MPNVKNNWRCLVGLTGGIGSGKSTVLKFFKKKGAFVLDADAIVHDLLEKNRAVLSAIRKKFGGDVFDGRGLLERRTLAAVVFKFPKGRKFLERLIHPYVRQTIFGELRKHKGKVAVIDVPLLYESGWAPTFDYVVVVDAHLKNRLKRLKKKGFEKADVLRRITLQMDLRAKVRRADFVVTNNGPLGGTKNQVDRIWEKLADTNHGGV